MNAIKIKLSIKVNKNDTCTNKKAEIFSAGLKRHGDWDAVNHSKQRVQDDICS